MISNTKRNNQFPTTKFKSSPTTLPKTEIENPNVVFSFEKFRCISVKNKEFNNCFTHLWEYGQWSLRLLERLSNFSSMKASDLKSAGNSTRCHQVKDKDLEKLKKVLVSAGLKLNEQLEDSDYFELSLGASSGRIFGYFVGNIYYVLLFDPHHLIYQQLQYGSQHDLLHKNYDPWIDVSV